MNVLFSLCVIPHGGENVLNKRKKKNIYTDEADLLMYHGSNFFGLVINFFFFCSIQTM